MTFKNATLELAKKLIACPSVTPQDQGTQQILIEHLKRIDFHCETMLYDSQDMPVTNLWAVREGALKQDAHVFAFAGHTDVVPPGSLSAWVSAPFSPTQRGGKLYGRGAADMKISIAAFVVACEEFVLEHPQHQHSIALLITSDEEGKAIHGTKQVCETLKARNQRIDYCLVGEPSSTDKLGDVIKNGRRGSLCGVLTVHGTQGHVAYPHLARNPIHLFAPALAELVAMQWDQGNEFFPATSWQVSNIHAGTGAANVVPSDLVIDFNFRFSTQSTPEYLQERLVAVLEKHKLNYDLKWSIDGLPFLTPEGKLVKAVKTAIEQHTGLQAQLSTSGGTSDGRFIANLCPQIVELGPVNASIHQVNEHVNIVDLEPLKNIYKSVLEHLCV